MDKQGILRAAEALRKLDDNDRTLAYQLADLLKEVRANSIVDVPKLLKPKRRFSAAARQRMVEGARLAAKKKKKKRMSKAHRLAISRAQKARLNGKKKRKEKTFLSDEDKVAIQLALVRGKPVPDIAAAYNISSSTVNRVRHMTLPHSNGEEEARAYATPEPGEKTALMEEIEEGRG